MGKHFSKPVAPRISRPSVKLSQNGDLAGAQSAFATLEGTFGQQSQQAQSAISAYNSNSGGAEIVINLGSPAGTSAASAIERVKRAGSCRERRPGRRFSSGRPAVPRSSSTWEARPARALRADRVDQPRRKCRNVGQGGGSSSGPSSGPEVVINLGGASSTSAASGSTTPEIVVNLGQESSSSSASPEEVTINLGSGSSGIGLDRNATQGQNSSPAEQLTINLNQQSNYELILNLLNSSAASSTQSSSNALSVSA